MLVQWLSRPRRYAVGPRPSLDSYRTTARTATIGEGGGVVLHGSRCGDRLIAHDQLVFYSSFMVEKQQELTATMSG
jgi:hypothetical protein